MGSEWYHRQSGVGVVSPSEWGQSSITVVSPTEWGRSGITVRVGSGWYHRQCGVGIVSPSEWGQGGITVRVGSRWYLRQSGVRVVSPGSRVLRASRCPALSRWPDRAPQTPQRDDRTEQQNTEAPRGTLCDVHKHSTHSSSVASAHPESNTHWTTLTTRCPVQRPASRRRDGFAPSLTLGGPSVLLLLLVSSQLEITLTSLGHNGQRSRPA